MFAPPATYLQYMNGNGNGAARYHGRGNGASPLGWWLGAQACPSPVGLAVPTLDAAGLECLRRVVVT